MISFIIVNYNTKVVTEECINSILNNKLIDSLFEIIVIDNDSTDDSSNYLKKVFNKYKNVKIIKNIKNVGFGNANNIGFRESKGEFLIFLNSDTVVSHTNFNVLLNQFSLEKKIGFLSSLVLNSNNTIQSIGYDRPSLKNDFKVNMLYWNFNFIKSVRLSKYNKKGLKQVGWVSGCFMICSKDDFLKLKGFDPNIFMYAEDLDICLRMERIGKRNYIYDETSIYHLHGKSSNNNKLFEKLYKQKKNYFYVLEKNNFGNISLIKFMTIYHIITLTFLKKIIEKVSFLRRKEGEIS